jgi:hypothetical protein
MNDVMPEDASTPRRTESWFGPGCVVLILGVVAIVFLLVLCTLWLVDEVADWPAHDPCAEPARAGEPRC